MALLKCFPGSLVGRELGHFLESTGVPGGGAQPFASMVWASGFGSYCLVVKGSSAIGLLAFKLGIPKLVMSCSGLRVRGFFVEWRGVNRLRIPAYPSYGHLRVLRCWRNLDRTSAKHPRTADDGRGKRSFIG